jgi:FkbM family methyltransferase
MIDQPFGKMAARHRYADIKVKLKSENPFIVDGGAHVGNVIDFFLRQYTSPTIHAFEPNPDLVATLELRYRQLANIYIYPYALGSESRKIPFNIINAGGKGGASSVFNPSQILKYYHGNNASIEKTIEVEVVRLDNIFRTIEIIDLLKLDLQGYELEALKGCENILSRIRIITTEIEFVPLYNNQPLFADIDAFLRGKDFRLLNLYELWTNQDAQLTAGDAVYLNNAFYPFGS